MRQLAFHFRFVQERDIQPNGNRAEGLKKGKENEKHNRKYAVQFRTSTTASRRNKIGLLAKIAFFLCSFTNLTLAQTPVRGNLVQIAAGATEVWGLNGEGEIYLPLGV